MPSARRLETLAAHVAAAWPAARPLPCSSGTRPEVCLVIGAGAGIGVNVARRFAKAGFVVALCRRSGEEGLQRAVREIEAEGGRAHGFLLDASKPGAIEDLVKRVEADVGSIQVAVYNLGAQIGNRPLETIDLKTFELGWRLGCEGLFRLAKVLMPEMVARGGGTLLVTSATAAMRGNAGQHSHAAAMGGRRMLCQTLNMEFAPKGVHVCHIIVDGAVNAPDTFGKMVGKEAFEKLRDEAGDSILQPVDMAETFFHVAQQRRSAWTFELDLRPYSVRPWWNHA